MNKFSVLILLSMFLALSAQAEGLREISTVDEPTAREEAIAENLGVESVPVNSQAIVRVRETKKTLGKGLTDRETGERMQLACIGDRLAPMSLERKCDLLRFLYANAGGEEFLIGPSFSLHDQASAKLQMKKAFAYWDISKSVDQKYNFRVTRMLYGQFFDRICNGSPDPSEGERASLTVGLIAAQGLGATLLMAGAVTSGGVVAGFFAGSILAPVVLDLALLPLTAIRDEKNAEKIWGFSGRDLERLQNRSEPAWQLKPAKTRSERFQLLLKSLIRVNREVTFAEEVFSELHFSRNSVIPRVRYDYYGKKFQTVEDVRREIDKAQEEAVLLMNLHVED